MSGPNKLEISYAHEYHWHTNGVQKKNQISECMISIVILGHLSSEIY